jgi:hypothetical protein
VAILTFDGSPSVSPMSYILTALESTDLSVTCPPPGGLFFPVTATQSGCRSWILAYPERRNGLAWSGSMLARRNFVNIEAAEQSRRKSGSVLRNAMVVTSSEEYTPGRMVRNHEPCSPRLDAGV